MTYDHYLTHHGSDLFDNCNLGSFDSLTNNGPKLRIPRSLNAFVNSEIQVPPVTKIDIRGSVSVLSPVLFTWTNLTTLSVAENLLETLPPDIGRLKNLIELDLSSNRITHLPPELGSLDQLQILDASKNRMKKIPLFLGRLYRLTNLNFTTNPLQGLEKMKSECIDNDLLIQHIMMEYLRSMPDPPERKWKFIANDEMEVKRKKTDSFSLENKKKKEDVDHFEENKTDFEEQYDHHSSKFTILSYNILCEQYASKTLYAYCPTDSLDWRNRRDVILREILKYRTSIIALQEVEAEQYDTFFRPHLAEYNYDGVFGVKSRANTMSSIDQKKVDGCALFFDETKFELLQRELIEFNQQAMDVVNTVHTDYLNLNNVTDAQVSDTTRKQMIDKHSHLINRVSSRDNIAIIGLFRLKTAKIGNNSNLNDNIIMVANSHIHWDPFYSDVKIVQIVLLVASLKRLCIDAIRCGLIKIPSMKDVDSRNVEQMTMKNLNNKQLCEILLSIPLVLCGDFNSLPISGVIEFLLKASLPLSHEDFKQYSYKNSLDVILGIHPSKDNQNDSTHNLNYNNNNKINNRGNRASSATSLTTIPSSNMIKHQFLFEDAYEGIILPFTNYTVDFKGVIDYIMYTKSTLKRRQILLPIPPEWFLENEILGCPHPLIPSDHMPIAVEFSLTRTTHNRDIFSEDNLMELVRQHYDVTGRSAISGDHGRYFETMKDNSSLRSTNSNHNQNVNNSNYNHVYDIHRILPTGDIDDENNLIINDGNVLNIEDSLIINDENVLNIEDNLPIEDSSVTNLKERMVNYLDEIDMSNIPHGKTTMFNESILRRSSNVKNVQHENYRKMRNNRSKKTRTRRSRRSLKFVDTKQKSEIVYEPHETVDKSQKNTLVAQNSTSSSGVSSMDSTFSPETVQGRENYHSVFTADYPELHHNESMTYNSPYVNDGNLKRVIRNNINNLSLGDISQHNIHQFNKRDSLSSEEEEKMIHDEKDRSSDEDDEINEDEEEDDENTKYNGYDDVNDDGIYGNEQIYYFPFNSSMNDQTNLGQHHLQQNLNQQHPTIHPLNRQTIGADILQRQQQQQQQQQQNQTFQQYTTEYLSQQEQQQQFQQTNNFNMYRPFFQASSFMMDNYYFSPVCYMSTIPYIQFPY
ncbi:hypothetical protein SNEBB_002924 [Seison nebaliae]|nr:hypothetical protein SNEBB_002924 [Seison nebaliae]